MPSISPEPAALAATTGPMELIVGLEARWFSIPADIVREIIPLPELAPVAAAPPYVVGMMNLRGRVVPVGDS